MIYYYYVFTLLRLTKKNTTPMTYTHLFTVIKIVPFIYSAIIYLYFFNSITQ